MVITNRTLVFQLVTLVIVTASAAERVLAQQVVAPASGAPSSSTQPGSLNLQASRVFTHVEGTGIGHDHGMEAQFSGGSLLLGATSSAGQLVIDMKSFDADTQLARTAVGLKGSSANWMRKQVNKEMHGNKILHSEDFPVATFRIHSCTPMAMAENDPPRYIAEGDFTLRGQTRRVSIRLNVQQDRGWLHVTGKFTFLQSDYGIEPLSKGFGTIGVADRLTVLGDLWLAPTAESLASLQSTRVRR